MSIRTLLVFVVSFTLATGVLVSSRKDPAKPEQGYICSKGRISIAQSQVANQPDGIPTFLVEISNAYPKPIGQIHLSCAQFSTVILINPNVFKRIAVGDCLVNNGQPLASGSVLFFKYATTRKYPFSVSSVSCS